MHTSMTTENPIPMVLHCPECRAQHIDKPDPERGWTNPPHRSHECQECGYIWRPADIPTSGVKSIATRGTHDGRPARPKMTAAQRRLAQSDAGRDLLTRALWMADGTEPIGNVNYSQIFEALKYGWVDGKGITPAGKAVLNAVNSPRRRSAGA